MAVNLIQPAHLIENACHAMFHRLIVLVAGEPLYWLLAMQAHAR